MGLIPQLDGQFDEAVKLIMACRGKVILTGVGKSRSAVANFLRLLKLPAEIQIAIRDGHITMG